MSLTTLSPSTTEWAMMKEQATMLVKTGFLPSSIRTAEQAIAIMLYGRELGIAPMQAFKAISVINGKPAQGAELMLAQIYRRYPNADVRIVRNEKNGAEVHAIRPGKDHVQKFEFNEEDAILANVLRKDSWRQYPKAMYLWRAMSQMARAVFPECLMGLSHTPEELGAEVDDDGEVIDVEVTEPVYEPVIEEPAAAKPAANTSAKGVFNKDKSSHRIWLAGALAKEKFPSTIHKEVEKALHNRPLADARAIADEIYKRAQGETPRGICGLKSDECSTVNILPSVRAAGE